MRYFNGILILILWSPWVLQAQEGYGKGLIFDDETYEASEMRATLLMRDYESLPASSSLKAWCPTPGSQGQYGTCTAWSIAYAARTIIEAQQQNWKVVTKITSEAFDPGFVYYHIRDYSDFNCNNGSRIDLGLDLLRQRGVPKRASNGQSCMSSVRSLLYSQAAGYKIKGYARLFSEYDSEGFKRQAVKKAIAEHHPVVIGMVCPPSFFQTSGAWRPVESNDKSRYDGHAMCVIGYDDNMYGGAFEIMNSWGTNWGNDGFIWIKYADFGRFVKYAYEVYPISPVSHQPVAHQLSGALNVTQINGEAYKAQLISSASGLPVYRLQNSMLTGTRYRILLTNHQPAFVYVLGGDQAGNVGRLFPHQSKISPYLSYKSSNIAIPKEDWHIEANMPQGNDYLWVIYAPQAISMDELLSRYASASGSFSERAAIAARGLLLPSSSVTFQTHTIGFSASNASSQAVSFLVEIPRK